jgi:gamma-glutamyltranspeptidase / glutathione hydrolase
MRHLHPASTLLLGLVLVPFLARALGAAGVEPVSPRAEATDLSPARWQEDYDRYLAAQLVERTRAGVATGFRGAVTVAYNALAARAGLEALEQGGNAMDALLTAGLTQVALTAGAPISYFGILSLVYYDAKSGEVHAMNAEWNTVLGETEPLSIPGGIDMSSADGIRGTATSGRTALVGGFMKGVGAAHGRFGKLPFEQLFAPAIFVAENGFPVSAKMAGYWELRAGDLARLPETRVTLLQPDGSSYAAGDLLRQPALAATLRAVARRGTERRAAR